MTSQDFLDDLWGTSKEVPLKSSTFNSLKLAQYFQEEFFSAEWSSGFALTDVRALSGIFAKWKKQGATVEKVTAMIDLYMSSAAMRGNNPGWRDFVWHTEQLSSAVAKRTEDSVGSEEDEEADALLEEFLARRKKT